MRRSFIFVTALLPAFLLACFSAPPFQIRRAPDFRSNLTPHETDAVLAAAREWIVAKEQGGGELRTLVFKSLFAVPPMLVITGCGHVGKRWFSDKWAVSVIGVREQDGWRMHSWQIDTEGLHGPPMPCR